MKFLERFALVVYSYIILVLAVILSLLIFNWIDFEVVTAMVQALITGTVSSKITLGICVAFILLSIKCMFFDERSKEVVKESQGILLKNENGQLLISKETIDNVVKNTVSGFENVKDCNSKIEVNEDNQIKIYLYLSVISLFASLFDKISSAKCSKSLKSSLFNFFFSSLAFTVGKNFIRFFF